MRIHYLIVFVLSLFICLDVTAGIPDDGSIVTDEKSDTTAVNIQMDTDTLIVHEHKTLSVFIDNCLQKGKQLYSNRKEDIYAYGPYVVTLALLIALIIILFRINKNKAAKKPTFPLQTVKQEPENDHPEIIVRRKTTSILKRQSLQDVLHNDAYLRIDASDFCSDSAVRRLYIKNSCIKDIYNMYQEDLRNPDNPKEDGCMVLGRWVYDDQTDEYYVSLETVVRPGDDAVFKEYELNFGGKIKLRVSENLRRLRRDTDLQYDMTCWVHSHPGLGIFFSNADNSVHLQLKHAAHPRFLTAIVVDILTPDMELGIFTFKRGHDLVVNSRQDLKRLYSLEDMYQWALENDRASYKKDDFYNVLEAAQVREESCDGIQLNNGAIIDICQFIAEQGSGLVGFGHGFIHTHGIHTEFVVEKISSSTTIPDRELLGCFIIGTHLSIPSIQKALGDYADSAKFVLFYSSAQQTLISIPILSGKIVMDNQYYSEIKMEELKVWTRRRR